MILAFSNDQTVMVFDDVRQANSSCEGVDVEDGVYTFTDERGFVFAPRFTTPNHRSRLFGLLPLVRSGVFTLELTSEQRLDLLAGMQAGHITVRSGPTQFSTSGT